MMGRVSCMDLGFCLCECVGEGFFEAIYGLCCARDVIDFCALDFDSLSSEYRHRIVANIKCLFAVVRELQKGDVANFALHNRHLDLHWAIERICYMACV